ncbi:fibroblast growth factor receptor substrate 3 isoform X1 [Terrapene carolina triunguis]|uniref:fibroblast growth factor receptor substrate 3 isoform X1 n=2 Tax=Terrapene triunguis TaxID=2587831 RepID=UPI000CEF9829|nr:fibroblast growth factor receptor substrate 3 isoform X1 [Terrapene carolina triunguis]XP_026510978.1 fibroblast growth factor receptor substrate 3-like isoform X1 [Terrapene carolina triunguis]XP_026510993.1 fibroblast growth factor receptor substrate 3-like isoform X1 [Terrapene carolina triunguis]XP_026511081.1 fibroblast growth factor receptor substrate 3-like isoform X1 [Terrapene carolina triunguis]XP_029768165.1 fibroblast growth factor receptor substrate 3-like isoform X1 [Terrapene 
MGSCYSYLCRDSVPDNHPTKFKVTNVDDEGNALGSGIMELTQMELILHTHKRDAVRWPYLCLRRYGYDSNLFSFESGRRCQTGQGIFAFKCSRAEEIFNLLQDLMQCNSINVVEEPVIMTRGNHSTELELSRTPQTTNALGYTVPGFPNGFHSFPGEAPSYSTARHPSMNSLRHSSIGEDSTHALIGPDEQSHTYVNTTSGEEEMRGRHCMHSLPEVHPPFLHGNHSCSLEDRNPQVFLQPGEVKFVLGPAPVHRHMVKRDSSCRYYRECGGHICGPNNNNECQDECLVPRCVYENVNGLLPAGGASLRRGGRLKLTREDLGLNSCSHRRTPLLHYENLPSLPPVWECQPLRQDEDSGDTLTPSPNGYPEPDEGDPLQNYMNSENTALHSGLRRDDFLQHRHNCTPSVFSFDFRRPCPEQQRQLNYIQVELEADPHKGRQSLQVPCAPLPAAHPASRMDSYAVIDLKKTAAMSNLQRALPRDDGTSRKTRHNSTDLPLGLHKPWSQESKVLSKALYIWLVSHRWTQGAQHRKWVSTCLGDPACANTKRN